MKYLYSAISVVIVIVIVIVSSVMLKKTIVTDTTSALKKMLNSIGKGVGKVTTIRNPVKNVNDILERAKPNPALLNDIRRINITAKNTNKQTEGIAKEVVATVTNEANVKSKQANLIASFNIERAKKEELERQKRASAEYMNIIKKIEDEKLKMGVIMAGIEREQQLLKKIK